MGNSSLEVEHLVVRAQGWKWGQIWPFYLAVGIDHALSLIYEVEVIVLSQFLSGLKSATEKQCSIHHLCF